MTDSPPPAIPPSGPMPPSADADLPEKRQALLDIIPVHDRTPEALAILDGMIAELTRLRTSIAIVTKERDEAREQANTDHLTGLHTRLTLEEEITRIGMRRQRKPDYIPATVVLIDIDKFKEVNSNFTHAGGDAALRHVADVLQSHLRSGDFLARLGGDEFALIMYNATPESASPHLEALKQKIVETPCVYKGKTIPLSISYGAHQMHENETLEDVIQATSERVTVHKDETSRIEKIGGVVDAILAAKRPDSIVERVTRDTNPDGQSLK